MQEAADAVDDDRAQLFQGGGKEPEDVVVSMKRASNDALLKKSRQTAKSTTDELRNGLTTLQEAEMVCVCLSTRPRPCKERVPQKLNERAL